MHSTRHAKLYKPTTSAGERPTHHSDLQVGDVALQSVEMVEALQIFQRQLPQQNMLTHHLLRACRLTQHVGVLQRDDDLGLSVGLTFSIMLVCNAFILPEGQYILLVVVICCCCCCCCCCWWFVLLLFLGGMEVGGGGGGA